jgi:hypothetical protein
MRNPVLMCTFELYWIVLRRGATDDQRSNSGLCVQTAGASSASRERLATMRENNFVPYGYCSLINAMRGEDLDGCCGEWPSILVCSFLSAVRNAFDETSPARPQRRNHPPDRSSGALRYSRATANPHHHHAGLGRHRTHAGRVRQRQLAG